MLPKSGQAEICALDKLLKYVIGDSDLRNSRIAPTWRVCRGVKPCVYWDRNLVLEVVFPGSCVMECEAVCVLGL